MEILPIAGGGGMAGGGGGGGGGVHLATALISCAGMKSQDKIGF